MRSVKLTPKQAAAIFRFAKQHDCKIEYIGEKQRTLFTIHNLPVGCDIGYLKITTSSHRDYNSIHNLEGFYWHGPVSLGSKRHVSYITNTQKNVGYLTLYKKQRMLSKKNPVELCFWIEKEK